MTEMTEIMQKFKDSKKAVEEKVKRIEHTDSFKQGFKDETEDTLDEGRIDTDDAYAAGATTALLEKIEAVLFADLSQTGEKDVIKKT